MTEVPGFHMIDSSVMKELNVERFELHFSFFSIPGFIEACFNVEAYSDPSRGSGMELFAKIANS